MTLVNLGIMLLSVRYSGRADGTNVLAAIPFAIDAAVSIASCFGDFNTFLPIREGEEMPPSSRFLPTTVIQSD
jgi:hypothetical protein